MNVLSFPPRDAGRILESAMRAAEAAASDETAAQLREAFGPTGNGTIAAVELEGACRVKALHAAIPVLSALTADEDMILILGHGMAEEAMIRLRKRGAA